MSKMRSHNRSKLVYAVSEIKPVQWLQLRLTYHDVKYATFYFKPINGTTITFFFITFL